jgi:ketosteroid isomerase-like protein
MENIFMINKRVAFLFAIMLLLLGSSCTNQGNKSANQKIIKDYYAAYEKKDWNMLTSLLADGFNFTSPMDDHIDLKTYKERCWPNAANIKRFDIEKLIVDGDDAFVTYNGWTNDGKSFRNTEFFQFKEGKISANTCFFGPGISFPNNTAK